jgi:hypothetical protein
MRSGLISLVFALAFAFSATAHEGHHQILGTVSAIHDKHLVVKTTSAKDETITIDDKTKVKRGTAVVKASDLHIGERVVVTAISKKGSDGKAMLLAEEVRVGVPPAAQPKK